MLPGQERICCCGVNWVRECSEDPGIRHHGTGPVGGPANLDQRWRRSRGWSNYLLRSDHARNRNGLHRAGIDSGRQRRRQRTYQALKASLLAVVLACATSCRRNDSPHATYNRAYQSFLRGDLEQCQEQAERARSRFLRSRPDWAWKFRILEAEATLWRGLYDEVPGRLQGPAPPPDQPQSAVSALTL